MIWTFYSYKGGVGRSMAVANLAEWLYLRELRVVVVDWDLEAPGIERFFAGEGDEVAALERQLGLVDLLLSYRSDFKLARAGAVTADATVRSIAPPLSRFLYPIYTPLEEQGLWLLPAGWRSGDRFAGYADNVQRFDWAEFYSRFEGAAFFDWLRTELLEMADVVLIDSRTGVTEMGGVCTRHLADVVVSLCAPNHQNLEGVLALTETFDRDEVIAERHGRSLETLVLPSRVDHDDVDQVNRFRDLFLRAVKERRLWPRDGGWDAERLWALRIPYAPKYSYREQLVVQRSSGAEALQAAYEGLGRALLGLAPEGSRLAQVERRERGDDRLPAAAHTAPVFMTPRPPSSAFAGRVDELQRIREALAEARRPVALCGMPGIGKTELALQYALRHQATYDAVLWVNAAGDMEAAFLDLASRLPGIEPDKPVPAVLRWLRTHSRWLLVFDDAVDPESLERYLPRGTEGHVIVTSRSPAWRGVATVLVVAALEPDTAVEVLLARTGDSDEASANLIAAQLGHHPLALTLAGAYADNTGRPLRDVFSLLSDRGDEFLSRAATTEGQNLNATFEPALARLDEASPDATRLLSLWAFFAGEPLEPALLADGVAAIGDDRLGELLSDPLELDGALADLRSESLGSFRDSALTIHPVLQSFVRRRLGETANAVAENALLLMNAVFPDGQGTRGLTAPRLAPHATTAVKHAETRNLRPADSAALAARVASTLEWRGNIWAARSLLEHTREHCGRALGAAAPEIARLERAELAIALAQGDAKGARHLFDRVFRRSVGASDVDRLNAAVAGALSDVDRGDMTNARNRLAGFAGEDHRSTRMVTAHALIAGLGNTKNLTATLANVAVGRARLTVDDDDPWLARVMGVAQLAILLADGSTSDDLQRAITIASEARPSVDGAAALSIAARVHELLDQPEVAIELHYAAVNVAAQVLDESQPRLARFLAAAGLARRAAGDIGGARPLLDQAARIWSAAYGPNHPNAPEPRPPEVLEALDLLSEELLLALAERPVVDSAG